MNNYNGDLVFSFKDGKFMGMHAGKGGGHHHAHHAHAAHHAPGVKGLPPHQPGNVNSLLKSAKYFPGDRGKTIGHGKYSGFITEGGATHGGGGGKHGGGGHGGASSAAGLHATYVKAMQKALGKGLANKDIGPYKVKGHEPKGHGGAKAAHPTGPGWFGGMAAAAAKGGPTLHGSHLAPTAKMKKGHLAGHHGIEAGGLVHPDHDASKHHGKKTFHDPNLKGGKLQGIAKKKHGSSLPEYLGSTPPKAAKKGGGGGGGGALGGLAAALGGAAKGGGGGKKDFASLTPKEIAHGEMEASKMSLKDVGKDFASLSHKEKKVKGFAPLRKKDDVALPPPPKADLPPAPALEKPGSHVHLSTGGIAHPSAGGK